MPISFFLEGGRSGDMFGGGVGVVKIKTKIMIIAVPPKTLNAEQKKQLAKKGNIVIEIDDPSKIRIISVETPIETHDYYMAALYALKADNSSFAHKQFIHELFRRLSTQETTTPEPQTPQQ